MAAKTTVIVTSNLTRYAIASLIIALRDQDQLLQSNYYLAGVQFFLYHLTVHQRRKTFGKSWDRTQVLLLHKRLLCPLEQSFLG